MIRPLQPTESTTHQARDEQLAAVLDAYLADLEQGGAGDVDRLLSDHPDLADDLRPCIESLHVLHGATHQLREHGSEKTTPTRKPGPRRIGDFELIRELGRGGMGIVYEAQQISLCRRVALKILPFAAMLDERQIARFRNEAQAAAQLHHTNIVPVFAVGQERGVHYYAMQFIEGQSLEQAIVELRGLTTQGAELQQVDNASAEGSTTTVAMLGTTAANHTTIHEREYLRAAVRLTRQAALALEHAHQFGIVHRDIKPSNLLVDAQGKLWVADFGLARVMSGTGVTVTGDVVGTLRYMSPEQAAGRSGLVDGRTDVYSLGATLYELLTLEQAFAGDDRHELLRAIERDEPTPPRRLNPAIPADLETIVLQAMAKSTNDRYTSAEQLADDLGRFLEGRPTLARRPTLLDRGAKWARRHRAMVATAVGCFVLVSLLSAAGVVLLARQQAATNAALAEARDHAVAAETSFARAEAHFRQARDVVDHFGVRIADRLDAMPGTEPLRRELLTGALAYYQKFVVQAEGDPALADDLAAAHFKAAVIHARLGDSAQATDQYRAAEGLLKRPADHAQRTARRDSQLALVHNNLGLLLASQGELDAARQEYARALARQEQLVDAHPDQPEYINQLAESQANLGMLLAELGDRPAAREALLEARAQLQQIVDQHPETPRYARNLAICFNNLSFVERKLDLPAAADAAQSAIKILENLSESTDPHPGWEGDLALCYHNHASILTQLERPDEAIEASRRAVACQERLARKSPAVVRYRSELAIGLNNLGVTCCRADQADEADEAFRRAHDLFAALADDYPDQLQYRSGLGALLNNQGLALVEAGRLAEACRAYEASVDALQKVIEQAPAIEATRGLLSRVYINQGHALRQAGDVEQAFATALAHRELWPGDGERLFQVSLELARLVEADASGETAAEVQQQIRQASSETIRLALAAGYEPEQGLHEDERLVALWSDPSFIELAEAHH